MNIEQNKHVLENSVFLYHLLGSKPLHCVLHNAHTFIERLVIYKEVNNCVLNLVLLHISHILKTINRVAPHFTRSERTEGNQNCK